MSGSGSHSNIRHGRRRAGWLRVAWLALALILANALAPWSMHAADAHGARASSHHCHPASPAQQPVPATCPCCENAGCQCLHASAAPLPEFPLIRPPAPVSLIVSRDWMVPAPPPTAERLRPPIA